MSSDITIKIDAFEGPLDLLLQLIKHLEIDIYDIPIADVTAQYLNYIRAMKVLQLDVAGDYLVMAATLMAIKSKLLLPKQEIDVSLDDEDSYQTSEDPRDALVEQLLEYRKFKAAAAILKVKEEERSQYFSKEPANLELLQEKVPLEPLQISTFDLVAAFQEMFNKKVKKIPLQTKIKAEETSINEKIEFIMGKLRSVKKNQGILFTNLFDTPTKNEMITTFMALLELIKEKNVFIQQKVTYGDIIVYPSVIEEIGDE